MNYRHHFHAGNFADVMKHTLLVALIQALQKKAKGFLYLDTHAGRGRYDLEAAATGDSRLRKPEWPDGIGRLAVASAGPATLGAYLDLVREFDRRAGNLTRTPRFYPGSPWIGKMLARPVDRVVLCEKHPDECNGLRSEFGGLGRTEVREMDGYVALRALLPPPERRALVLLDPPFEAQDEFAQVADAMREGWRRFPSGILVAWYPLTERARVDEFLAAVQGMASPPALACELTVAGEAARLKMRGCGLLVINPPWQFEATAREVLSMLAVALAQAPGGQARVEWIVPAA